MINQEQIISRSIDYLRFPLAIFVVMQHVSPDVANWAGTQLLNDSRQLEVLEFIMRFFSITLAGIAVPVFYAISGYLLFNKSGEAWSFALYKNQVCKRIKSLVVPYFLWNGIVFIFLYCCLPFIKVVLGHADISLLYESIHKFWMIFNISGVPIDGPLYFIRNLFFLVLLSPIIFQLIKKYSITFVIFLTALWLFVDISTENPIYSYIKALLFFTIGAYVGIKKPSIQWLFHNNRFFVVLFVISIIFDCVFAVGLIDNHLLCNLNNYGYYNEINQFSFRLSNIIGLFASVGIAGVLSQDNHKFESINGSVFFIYSAHVMVIYVGGGYNWNCTH